MKESGLGPAEWSKLSRTDKQILHHMRTMEYYMLEFSPEQIKARADEKKHKKQAAMGGMPAQAGR